jgi:hypothetical protein
MVVEGPVGTLQQRATQQAMTLGVGLFVGLREVSWCLDVPVFWPGSYIPTSLGVSLLPRVFPHVSVYSCLHKIHLIT